MKSKILVILDTYRIRFPSTSKMFTRIYNVLIQQTINLFYKSKIIPKLRKILKKEVMSIYSLDSETSRKLSQKNIEFKNTEDLIKSDLPKNIEQNSSIFIKNICNKSYEFKQVLRYNDTSLWDLAQFDTWFYLKKRIEILETVKEIIIKEKPKEIVIFDKNSDLGRVCLIAANHYGIKVIDKTSLFSNFFNSIKKSILPSAYGLTKPWGVGKLKLKNKKIKSRESTRKKITLFGNHLFPSKLLTLWSSKTTDFDILFVYFNKADNLKKENMPNVSFEDIADYSNPEIKKNINKRSKELKLFWKKASKDNNFKKNFIYESFNIYPLIEDLLDYYFRHNFVEIIKYLELSKNVFLTEKPELNISYDEISRISKCVNYSASKNNVKTILIQHGALAEYPLYGNFYSNIFALYGENSKKIYQNWGVDKSKIKIIGNIKFDELYNKMKNYKKEPTLRKLNITENKKIILFTSQPVTNEENEILLYEIFNEFRKLPQEDYHLVIKLHPAEDGRLHRNVAKAFDNYTIVQDIDIFEMINASDLVITYWSTTGLESMVLRKPVIVLNLSGKPDKVAYAKSGAALGIYKKGELKEAILKCLSDKAFIKRMFDLQSKFIYDEAYKFDGHVADRLLNIIDGD